MKVFLGNWMPAQQAHYVQLGKTATVEQLRKNLEGAEFPLAVADYVYAAGVHDYADLAKFADKFDHNIYGIGAGASANQSLQESSRKTSSTCANGSWWSPVNRRCCPRLSRR
ncbi:ABC-type proline/glycine betaine transport system substrate-binding protein [Pseudomonas sp. TE3786]